jgi:hypothetical protein
MPTYVFDLAPDGSEIPVAELDGVYVHNPDHVAQAQNNLIQLFKTGPRNQAVMAASGAQWQELEDVARDLITKFLLPTAEGHQLELLGASVGESRQGRLDDDYRAAISVRVMVNRSNGHAEEMIEIASTMVPAASVSYAEVYPATMLIGMSTLSAVTLRTVFNMLLQAKAGGVRLLLTYGGTMGAVDGDPAGGIMGAVDGDPAGFEMGGGT